MTFVLNQDLRKAIEEAALITGLEKSAGSWEIKDHTSVLAWIYVPFSYHRL